MTNNNKIINTFGKTDFGLNKIVLYSHIVSILNVLFGMRTLSKL